MVARVIKCGSFGVEWRAKMASKNDLPTYLVQRMRLNDDVYFGPTHLSYDGAYTLCGREINFYWGIKMVGVKLEICVVQFATCKKCLDLVQSK